MSTKMQRLFSLMMAVLMMLSLTACGGNATSSTPASVSGSGSESGEQVSEAAKRLEEQKELNIMFVAGNFAESMQKIYADYEKEYGVDTLCMHADAIKPGQRVLIVDDLLATGGTVKATIEMIEKLGGIVAGCAFLIELDDLKGREAIGDYDYKVLMHY